MDRAPRTVNCYVAHLRLLAEHFQSDPHQITPDQIREYFLFLRNEKNYAPGTMNQARVSLRTFYHKHHPHIHYLLPLGALTPEGTWKRPKNTKYFLPVKALSVRMRTLMQRAMRQADPALYKTIAPKIWRLGWNTDIRHVGKGDTAVGYLARYISQSALSAKRILSDDGRHVRIAYTCSQSGQKKTLRHRSRVCAPSPPTHTAQRL
jgi:hypothetical protein